MDKIIEALLEIDREAQQRIDEAHRQEGSLEEELQREKQEMLRQLSDRSQQKLQTVLHTEHEYAAGKIREIEQHKVQVLQKLDKIFQDNHQQWEQILYDRVLGR